MKNFILVNDPEIIKVMKNAGFGIVQENKNFCVFANAPEKFKFCHVDRTKLFETNKLNF